MKKICSWKGFIMYYVLNFFLIEVLSVWGRGNQKCSVFACLIVSYISIYIAHYSKITNIKKFIYIFFFIIVLFRSVPVILPRTTLLEPESLAQSLSWYHKSKWSRS